nr:putative late blight resistance protein homolog R1A-10 [Ipomoea batatas]
MAYAAVTSLKGTLYLHFLQSEPCLPLMYKRKIVSLHRNLGFFQEILEKSEIAYDNAGAMKDVEAEIRDVSFKAEESIEMELTNIYVEAKGWTKRVACLLRLHGIFNEAVEKTDYLKKKLIKIKSKQQQQLAKEAYPWISVRPRCPNIQLRSMRYDKFHSLHSFDYNIDFNIRVLCHFKLLRVVDMELAFRHFGDKSFIVQGCFVILDSSEASRIWKMPLLRNFYVERIPLSLEASELEKLSIKEWHLELQDRGIQWATSFLPNLKKLKFVKTKLPWNNMRLIGMLLNLEVLKLKHACLGKNWKPSEGGFRQLKRLVIKSKCLEYWNAAGDHFPVLEHLDLSGCELLRKIPIEFADITTLALIQLNKCRYSVLVSALCIQDEQRRYGNDGLCVCSKHTQVSPVPNGL